MKESFLHVFILLLMITMLSSCGSKEEGVKAESLDGLPFSDEMIYDEPFALVNDYDAFLAAGNDNDTLILSDKPYMWKLEKGESGSHVLSADNQSLMFDLDNASYEEGTKVHLFEDTSYLCQFWDFVGSGDGFIITSAEDPDWCILSAEEGFTLGKKEQAGRNDTWRIIRDGDWKEGFLSPAEAPYYQVAESYTPTPEFWEEFDKDGITEEMKASSVHHGEDCAQYLNVFPEIDDAGEGFDFFSVEFCTDTSVDATYWALANWGMDYKEYMKRNGYTEYDTVGAYGGLQDVIDHNTKIMSIWETYFKGPEGELTLVPECVYPENESSYFDHEGSGTSLVAPFEWKAGTWYRYVLRSWQKNDTTYVGSWAEDLSTGEVSLLAVYDTLLPESFINGSVPYQFLENYGDKYYGEYRQMKLRNFCVRGADSGKWYFADRVSFSIWTDLGHNQGTYRYSVEGDTVIGETCGLGEDVCKGMTEDETRKTFNIRTSEEAPDPDRYEIPEL